LNRLSLRSAGHSCEATFFNIDKDLFNPTALHVFGSLCFVLDSRLQSGIAGPPKWEPRSRLGIYVGHSPSHAGSVALVLNPRMGHVSPQFHVVFDDLFTTVSYMKKSEVPPNWAKLVEKFSEQVTDEDYDLAKMWFSQIQIMVTLLCKKQITQELLLEILTTLFKQCSLLDIMH
jgi:hypothetical protein